MKKISIMTLGVVIGLLIGGSSIYAVTTLYEANEVGYDNASSGTSNTDVQGALDELYELTNTCMFDEQTGAEMLVEKANDIGITNYADGNKGEMYVFYHEKTEQVPANIDYRYIGNVPNNYITFNNETWRIIGVFDGRIKIIRESPLENVAWDTSLGNDWENASLQKQLNDGSEAWQLSAEAFNQIETVTWYLGGNASWTGHAAPNYYAFERGNSTYNGRSRSWQGKVGLMYPSDYAYTYAYGVNQGCYSNTYNCVTNANSGWLYNNKHTFTMSPSSNSGNHVYYIGLTGSLTGAGTNLTLTARPVVYLKESLLLSNSLGTIEDPYLIQ